MGMGMGMGPRPGPGPRGMVYPSMMGMGMMPPGASMMPPGASMPYGSGPMAPHHMNPPRMPAGRGFPQHHWRGPPMGYPRPGMMGPGGPGGPGGPRGPGGPGGPPVSAPPGSNMYPPRHMGHALPPQ